MALRKVEEMKTKRPKKVRDVGDVAPIPCHDASITAANSYLVHSPVERITPATPKCVICLKCHQFVKISDQGQLVHDHERRAIEEAKLKALGSK